MAAYGHFDCVASLPTLALWILLCGPRLKGPCVVDLALWTLLRGRFLKFSDLKFLNFHVSETLKNLTFDCCGYFFKSHDFKKCARVQTHLTPVLSSCHQYNRGVGQFDVTCKSLLSLLSFRTGRILFLFRTLLLIFPFLFIKIRSTVIKVSSDRRTCKSEGSQLDCTMSATHRDSSNLRMRKMAHNGQRIAFI